MIQVPSSEFRVSSWARQFKVLCSEFEVFRTWNLDLLLTIANDIKVVSLSLRV